MLFDRREEAREDIAIEKTVRFQIHVDPGRILAVTLDHVQFGAGRKRLFGVEVRSWSPSQLETAARNYHVASGRKC
jgi:hypothetical protein